MKLSEYYRLKKPFYLQRGRQERMSRKYFLSCFIAEAMHRKLKCLTSSVASQSRKYLKATKRKAVITVHNEGCKIKISTSFRIFLLPELVACNIVCFVVCFISLSFFTLICNIRQLEEFSKNATLQI